MGPLAQEHELQSEEDDRLLADVEDLWELLRCHWVSDELTFPSERRRVDLAAFLLLAAFMGLRPGAILGITYRDLKLFVLREKTTREVALGLQIC